MRLETLPGPGRPGAEWREPASGAVRRIAVGGSQLGVGASTVAALLGLAAAEAGWDTLLCDTDAGGPALARLLRGGADRPLPPRLRLRHLAPAAPRWPPEPADLVVIDAGSVVETIGSACAGRVDRLLLVTTAGRTAIAAAYGLLKALETRYPGMRIEIVLNRHDPAEPARTAFDCLQEAALTFLRRAVGWAGAIPDDPCLRIATRGGMCLEDAAAESDVARAIERITTRLLATGEAPRAALPGPRHLVGGA